MGANEWRYLVEQLVGYLSDGTPLYYVEIGGPSGTSKPTTSSNGGAICAMSIAVEDDTGKCYFYDEADGWGEPRFTFGA